MSCSKICIHIVAPLPICFQVLSDLHLEFAEYAPVVAAADAVILAGDIDLGVKGIEWAARHFEGRRVFYVLGNHEYYGHAAPRLAARAVDYGCRLGVEVLDNADAVVGGVRVVGTTLWTDLRAAGEDPGVLDVVHEEMSDYRKIRVSPHFRRVTPVDTRRWHAHALRWLESALARPHPGPTVVVTHHAPLLASLPQSMTTDPLRAAYASELDSLIAASKPDVWIHGHTHHSVDFRFHSTRVISNQRGYPGEGPTGFDPGFTVVL